jgi:hypothetical protein
VPLAAEGQVLGALYEHPHKAVGKAVCHRSFGKVLHELAGSDVAQDAHMWVRGPQRGVLDHGLWRLAVPGVAEHRGEGVALALHHLERLGELVLLDEEPLIRNAGVNDFHLAVFVWGRYGVSYFGYEALAAG